MSDRDYQNSSYRDFFKKATGNDPYPYQEAFHQRKITSFCTLEAPTGAGKTEAFTCDWLYGRMNNGENTPRRLAIASPLRTLVEQTHRRIHIVIKNLKLEQRFSVYLLMGGRVENNWDRDISREIIIVGTQDQILSRQLNRGYCLSRARFPIHFAALNNDCRVVVDETQLQGIGYKTAIYLQNLRDEIGCYGNTQLILCSATLDTAPLDRLIKESEREIAVGTRTISDADFNHQFLGKKLKKNKQLSKARTIWKGESNTQFIDSLCQEVLTQHVSSTLTLIILNRVDSARELYRHLEIQTDIPLKLLHSQFRKGDRQKLVENLIDFKGIIVATQCVEAGIDLDARVLFTELCPWSSFVQRCGRAGRNNTYSDTIIFWIDHKSLDNEFHVKPYDSQELKDSRKLIKSLGNNASIQNLLSQSAPFQPIAADTISKEDIVKLFHTHHEPNETDLDFGRYIREIIDNNVYVAWREFEGQPPKDAVVREIEVCSIPIGKVRSFSAKGWKYDYHQNCWQEVKSDSITPGTTILFSCSVGGYSRKLGWTGNPQDIPSPIETDVSLDRDRGEFSSYSSHQVSLKQHSLDVAREMSELIERLQEILEPGLAEHLIEAAQWHDLGKAHEVFQETIGGDESKLLAKLARISSRRHRRKGFRHELASALAALAVGKPFIFAYLVCCHHGKVRTRLLNTFLYQCSDNFSCYYNGIREGDTLPLVDLGLPIELVEPLTLSYNKIPGDKKHPAIKWEEEVEKLIEHQHIGVFRLAYLETLIRCADEIASSKYQ